jgi:hypothetical protein
MERMQPIIFININNKCLWCKKLHQFLNWQIIHLNQHTYQVLTVGNVKRIITPHKFNVKCVDIYWIQITQLKKWIFILCLVCKYSYNWRSLKYNIDKKIIQQKVKELQKKYHPDKFTNKDKQTQIYST